MDVVEPGGDGNCVGGMEDITRRRVVDDDGVLEISAELTEVLDIVAHVVVTGFSKEAMVHDLVDVEHVQHGIGILGQGGRKDDNLKVLSHDAHKLVDSRSLDDIDVVVDAIDLYRHDEIGLVNDLNKKVSLAAQI